MRRIGLIVALGALLGMLGGAATASPALADGRGDGWVFQDFPPSFSSDNCGFHIKATQDVAKVFTKTLKTASGSAAGARSRRWPVIITSGPFMG